MKNQKPKTKNILALGTYSRCPQSITACVAYNRVYSMRAYTERTRRFFTALILSAALILPTTYYLLPTSAYAATSFNATPVVIDGKGKQREILRYSVSVENTTKHLVSIYPWVTDVDTKIGQEGAHDLQGSVDKELAASLARWIEVTRGSVDLLPGDKKDISITVQINLNAKPGMYHATIHLSAGGDRDSAEKNLADAVDVNMNVEVLEDINERLQLATFLPAKNVFSGDQADFSYSIENIGNRGLIPHGKIRIYDRRGQEIATIDANKNGKKLEPSAHELLSSVWTSGNEFGRYKAMLDIEYGGHGTLQDTVFFWVIPWKKLLGMFMTLIIICVVVAIGLHSYGEAQRGRRRFAPAFTGNSHRRVFGFFGREKVKEDYPEDELEEAKPLPVYQREGREGRMATKELREVPLPNPIHTRLHSRMSNDTGAQVSLHQRPHDQPSSHQVILGKREPPAVPLQHIINLKR